MLPDAKASRYFKFSIDDVDSIPQINRTFLVPPSGIRRAYEEASFSPLSFEGISPIKSTKNLPPLGKCCYCGESESVKTALTDEHIIPEFLGAGLVLPRATCAECQRIIQKYESSIATDMFDSVRRSFAISGKNGRLTKKNFPIDVGRETTNWEMLSEIEHPTLLTMPSLYPASSFSRCDPMNTMPLGLVICNVNVSKEKLTRLGLNSVQTPHIDMVRFAQFIAKIAHSFASHCFRDIPFEPILKQLIRTVYPPGASAEGYLSNVGGTRNSQYTGDLEYLHTIESGTVDWNGARLRTH